MKNKNIITTNSTSPTSPRCVDPRPKKRKPKPKRPTVKVVRWCCAWRWGDASGVDIYETRKAARGDVACLRGVGYTTGPITRVEIEVPGVGR